jgi:hypothetical protein
MKNAIFTLALALSFLAPAAFASTGSATLIISVNKTVPLAEAETIAAKLEFHDPNMGTCYVDSHVNQYIPYTSCYNDSSCPYWGVALVDLKWTCDLPLKLWLEKIQGDRNYTIYSNGPIGPFPIVSGGN